MEPEDLSLHHLVSGARTTTVRLPDEEDTLDRSPLEAQRITQQIEKELLQAEKAFIVSRKRSLDDGGVDGCGGGGDEGGEGSSSGVAADRLQEDTPGDDGSIGGDVPENGRPSARERETYSKGTGGLADALGLAGQTATVATESPPSSVTAASSPPPPRPLLDALPATITVIAEAKENGIKFMTGTEESTLE